MWYVVWDNFTIGNTVYGAGSYAVSGDRFIAEAMARSMNDIYGNDAHRAVFIDDEVAIGDGM